MIAALGGVEAIVFSAGIGEHSPEVRAGACAAFGFLGLRLDEGKNASAADDGDIAAEDSAVRVLVIRAEEDWEIACECRRVLGGA
jgi:acetate kinase